MFPSYLMGGTQIKNADSLSYAESTKILKTLPEYFIPVGSYLSHQPVQNDLDFIITDPHNLIEIRKMMEHRFPETWLLTKGGRGLVSRRLDYFPVIHGKKLVMNFWYAKKDEVPFFILAYGYPRGFSIAIKKQIKDKGYHLSQYGLFDSKGNKLKASLADVFDILGLPIRTPREEYEKHHKK
jgi:DNA polymerase/3'-5' exonuclease PolX